MGKPMNTPKKRKKEDIAKLEALASGTGYDNAALGLAYLRFQQLLTFNLTTYAILERRKLEGENVNDILDDMILAANK